MKQSFGKWLKDQIDTIGLTQGEFANRIGIQQSQVSRIISGERGTTIEVLEGIARVLRLPPEAVFNAAVGKITENEKTELIRQITYLSAELSLQEQEDILEFVKLRHRLAEERGKNEKKRPKERALSTE